MHESILRHPLYQIPNHETIEKNTKYRKSKNRNKLILNPGIIDCILTKLLISTNNQTQDRLDLSLFYLNLKILKFLKGLFLEIYTHLQVTVQPLNFYLKLRRQTLWKTKILFNFI